MGACNIQGTHVPEGCGEHAPIRGAVDLYEHVSFPGASHIAIFFDKESATGGVHDFVTLYQDETCLPLWLPSAVKKLFEEVKVEGVLVGECQKALAACCNDVERARLWVKEELGRQVKDEEEGDWKEVCGLYWNAPEDIQFNLQTAEVYFSDCMLIPIPQEVHAHPDFQLEGACGWLSELFDHLLKEAKEFNLDQRKFLHEHPKIWVSDYALEVTKAHVQRICPR